MTQTVLSVGYSSNVYAPPCNDPFQISDEECPLVSKIGGSFFGYDSERNECREIHSLVCDSQKSTLFKVIFK